MRLKTFLISLIGLMFFAITFIIAFMMYGQKEIQAFEFENIVVSDLADGTYHGSYGKARWSNTVTITVLNGEITHIEITKSVLFEREEITASIIDEILTKQSLDIDIQSGATITTKAYLKSILNAINEN
jgi:uncharacterized protein with FMN-binding domain